MAARLIDPSLPQTFGSLVRRGWPGGTGVLLAPLLVAVLPGMAGGLAGAGVGLAGLTWLLSISRHIEERATPVDPQIEAVGQARSVLRMLIRMLTLALTLALSLVLAGLVLGFLAIMTVLVVTLVAMGIMASSGFDFAQAGTSPDAMQTAMAAYRETPGWQICLGVFGVGLAAWLFAVALFLPSPAQSVREGRVVVLEGLRRSRGRGIALLVLLGVALAPALSAGLLVPNGPVHALATGLTALLLALASLRADAVLPQFSIETDRPS